MEKINCIALDKRGCTEVFSKEYKKIYAEIRSYSIAKKAKYSSKKHLLAFIAAKIHPGLYCFLKNDMKLQYKR